jgi:hypothetical protein
VFEPAASRPQGPRPSRPSYPAGPERPDRESYLAGPERPARELPGDPAAVDVDPTPRPTRPAPAPPGRLAARGRHAGTPAAADGKDQRPPERDDEQQAEAHPLRPEPTSGTSQGRPKGG